MDTYPLDIAAKQIVRWLMDEERGGNRELQISASRTYLCEEIPTPQERGLGDEEREDLTEVTTVGILEVAPPHKAEGWLLRVRIEDAIGQRLPDDISASDEPEEIDLEKFWETFIVPQHGTAFVAVDTETVEAWASFQRMLDEMRANRHAG